MIVVRKRALGIAAVVSALLVCSSARGANPPAGQGMTAEQFEAQLKYQEGKVTVGDGLASFDLGGAFRYLDPKQTGRVLAVWGNPPGSETLGMLVPAGMSTVSEGSWAIIISYDADGYVDDKGAEKIDYDDMLVKMKKDAVEANKERRKNGFDPVEVVGWAEPPLYDKASHKLYWAKDLKFGNQPKDTLNYNIRVLGRRGVLVLNAVAGMDQIATVKTSMQRLLPAVEFNQGHRYADFIPGKDKLAEYGIGALVVGTLAAKTGLFKALLVGLLAFKKALIVGLAALGAWFRKMFAKKKAAAQAPIEP